VELYFIACILCSIAERPNFRVVDRCQWWSWNGTSLMPCSQRGAIIAQLKEEVIGRPSRRHARHHETSAEAIRQAAPENDSR